MDFLVSMSEMDSNMAVDIGPCELLPANSPPPLADDTMDDGDVDDVEDCLFDDFKVETPCDTRYLAYWEPSTVDKKVATSAPVPHSADPASTLVAIPNQADKDHIAIVQELPPSLESKRPFGLACETRRASDMNQFTGTFQASNGATMLPWDAFVQSHIQYGHQNKTTYQNQIQKSQPTLPPVIFKPTTLQVHTAIIPPKPEDFLIAAAADTNNLLNNLSLPPGLLTTNTAMQPAPDLYDYQSNIMHKDDPDYLRKEPSYSPEATLERFLTPPPQSTTSNSTAAITAPSSTSSSTAASADSVPELTEAERKRRNRVYAKRSRDLKNQKYRDAIELNKDLQQRLKAMQEANQKLKLRNQSLEVEVKETRQKLAAYEKAAAKAAR